MTWRAGLDLDPVDISDPSQAAWLEALVWPEQGDRLAKLRIAMRIAAEKKPRIVKGDLRTDLARLAAEAPKDATLVIFHTAVLAYIRSLPEREEFARSVKTLCDSWISIESPRVFPKIAARAATEELCASSSANWLWLRVRWFIQVNRAASLCSIGNDHPFVPTCLPAERRAQRQSRMPSRMRRHRRSRRAASLTERARC